MAIEIRILKERWATCERPSCGHSWKPRDQREDGKLPAACPKCTKYNWNKPR